MENQRIRRLQISDYSIVRMPSLRRTGKKPNCSILSMTFGNTNKNPLIKGLHQKPLFFINISHLFSFLTSSKVLDLLFIFLPDYQKSIPELTTIKSSSQQNSYFYKLECCENILCALYENTLFRKGIPLESVVES